MSRWRNSSETKSGFSEFIKEAMDVAPGNPTGTGVLSPADRARQLGLQSNGRGGYIDPNSGQVVAQTVNGELVFYSQNRASGGAVSDSSGGAALVSDAPSWADPVTGMTVTPPGKAETPEEQGSVPDPVPAKAPHGYNSFMVQRKQQAYEQDIQQQDQQAPEGDMDLGGQQVENYLPGDLIKRTEGQAPPPTFKGMRDRIAKAPLSHLVDKTKLQQRQALRAIGNQTPDSALQNIKAPRDISKDNKTTQSYLSKVKDAIDGTYADSEKEMDPDEAQRQRAGSSQAQRDIIQGKGAFGASNDEIEDFKSFMAAARTRRNQKELDDAESRPKPSVNVGKDAVGKGSDTSKIESAQLFALKRVIQDGVMPGDFDLEKDLEQIYGQNADKVRSSISGARELAKHLGMSPGEMTDEYEFGKFDGQSTTIGDEDRSNLYDEIYNSIVTGLGKKGLPDKKTTKKGEVDWSDKEIAAKGGDLLGALTQTKRGAGLKDNLQTADVYMNRKEQKEQITKDIDTLLDNFGDQPQVAMMMLQGYLAKQHNNRNLMGISLKELSPGAEKMSVKEYNTGLDDWVDILNSNLQGNNKLNFSLGKKGKGNSQVFDFDNNSLTFDGELEGVRGEEKDEEFNLPFQWESRPSGTSDTLKVEPNDKFKVDRGQQKSIGQMRRKTGHLGMLSQEKMNDIVKQNTGHDLDHMIPEKIGSDYTPEMREHWKSTLKELADPESDSPFNLKGPFSFNDEEMDTDSFIDSMLDASQHSSFTSPEFLDKFGVPRSAKTQQAIRQKLRHLTILKTLNDAHNEGKGHSLLGQYLMGAGKINQSPDEFYMPRIQIS
jgi:hypothetical protein